MATPLTIDTRTGIIGIRSEQTRSAACGSWTGPDHLTHHQCDGSTWAGPCHCPCHDHNN